MAHPIAASLLLALLQIGGPSTGRPELERYLNVRGNAFSGFSADGKSAIFLSSVTGTAQVWRLALDGPAWPTQVTWWSDRAQGAIPAPVGDWIAVPRDSGGNENSQIWLVKTDGSQMRDLTAAPDVKHDWGGWSWDGKKLAWSSNARTQKDVLAWRAKKKADPVGAGDEPPTSNDVYVCDVETGARQCVFEAKPGELYSSEGFSPDGGKLLLSRANGSIDNDLFLLDLRTKECKHLTPHKDVSDFSAEFSADGKSLWVVTNEGREFHGLFRWNLETGAREEIRTPKAEVESISQSRDGKWLAVGTAKDAGREIEILDTATMKGQALPTGIGMPGSVDFLEGKPCVGFSMNGPLDPTDIFLYDLEKREKRRLTQAFLAGLDRGTFVEPEAVRYKSFDGLEIEALLYRPKGAKNLPTIVEFHGGPEGQSRPNFSSLAQYFVACGYAFFQPNVRGSTGYGRTFTHLDDVRLREDSVKDGAAAVKWLVESGTADSKRVVVMGGSYGGYMTLACLTLYPELWAAGVDTVGIANFVSFLENTSGYRRRLRESEYGVAGTAAAPGPDREFLTQISPLARVEKIQAPLLVIHGEQDPRVPVGEARQIEAALKKLGRPVEALYYPDEGHGIAKLKNRLDCYPKVISFLDRVLGRL